MVVCASYDSMYLHIPSICQYGMIPTETQKGNKKPAMLGKHAGSEGF